MTDDRMYKLLEAKSKDIKMHMLPEEVAETAKRFKALSDREMPMMPVGYEAGLDNNDGVIIAYECPKCRSSLKADDQYGWCPECGQCLTWEFDNDII